MESSYGKKLIIWTKGLDDFLEGSAKFNGGIAVQLTFWAKAFLAQGWTVYSFSKRADAKIHGINFIEYRSRSGPVAAVFDCFAPLFFFYRIRPEAVIFRGASRNLFFVSLWARVLGIKVIFMGAHDTDFEPSKEIINRVHDKLVYRAGVRLTNNVIVQNHTQKTLLDKFYGRKKSILIPNIWGGDDLAPAVSLGQEDYLLWVSNFHRRKRPQLYIDLARQIPARQFLMIGGDNDRTLYTECNQLASTVNNLYFLGGLPFLLANAYFRNARVFICTSESEGFPNTFLQAWANEIPVVTTFDPGGVISANALGIVVADLNDLVSATNQLLNDVDLYNSFAKNIRAYFKANHDADYAYCRLTEFMSL